MKNDRLCSRSFCFMKIYIDVLRIFNFFKVGYTPQWLVDLYRWLDIAIFCRSQYPPDLSKEQLMHPVKVSIRKLLSSLNA